MIDTTRPELLVSCVALVCHPDDERYAGLVGRTVRTPVFDVEVPVVVHPLAEQDKGTGIAMVCTFGDTTDVTWWRELDLPTRNVIRRDGRFGADVPEWLTADGARTAYAELAGKTVKQAQAATVELVRASGDLHGEPRPITHPVKFYERGSRPLEIVTSRQWYIRNGGREHGPPGDVPRPRQGAGVVPRPHAPPLRALGRRAQRRLADQPAALLRRADPAVVPGRRRRRAGLVGADRPGRVDAADRPLDRRPARLSTPDSADGPAASSATRT